jgi:hypothetical protein
VAATAQAEEFDRRLPVARGTRLQVRLYGGEVVVRGWDRDEVRVRASLFRTDSIDIQSDTPLLRVGSQSSQGAPHAIDLQIDAPAWMAIDVKGTYLDIAMEGLSAEVTAETVRGDVRLKGGAGTITLKSVEGEVVLEGARGQATLSAVNNGIRVTDLVGDLFAESVRGTVRLQRIEARSITVSTESGDISWDGLMSPQGRYQFATHSGDVDVTLPERADAAIFVRPFGGRFRTTFPLPLPEEAAQGKRFSVTLGTGAARLDLETFSGTISLRRAEPAPH